MANYSSEIWVLNTKEEMEEYYIVVSRVKIQAVGWANRRLANFPAKIKTGEDIYNEAVYVMTEEIICGKLKVYKNYFYTKNTLYNKMKQIIYRYMHEEGPILREHQYIDGFQFETAVNMAVIKGWCTSPAETEEHERYYRQLLKEFLETLTGNQKKIVQVTLSDENDFRRMLYPVAGALTDELIVELLQKKYIDQNGDTTPKFKRDKPPASLRLSSQFKLLRKKIHKVLKANRIITTRSMIASYLGITLREVISNCRNIEYEFKRFKRDFDERYFKDNPESEEV